MSSNKEGIKKTEVGLTSASPYALCGMPGALDRAISRAGCFLCGKWGVLPIPPKRCISGVRRSALEPLKREGLAEHLWAKPTNTLYGVINDDFASETRCRKEDVAVLRLKKSRIYPGALMADTACRIDAIERALILRNQAV